MRWVTIAAAVEAAATGLILFVSPALFAWLILGGELSEPGQALGRLTGIVLLAFGLVCWPAPVGAGETTATMRAMLIYNVLATIYLVYLGVSARLGGRLLWPAVAVHVILTILVGGAWRAAEAKRRGG